MSYEITKGSQVYVAKQKSAGKITRYLMIREQPLNVKMERTKQAIRDAMRHHELYLAFSGGKDSTVLLYIIREIMGIGAEIIPAVFSDTGNEYKGVYEFAMSLADVVIKPDLTPKQIIEKFGYPLFNKRTAQGIREYRNKRDKNKPFNAYDKTLYLKYAEFIDSNILISEQCCDYLKKKPFKKYSKISGKECITGERVQESARRATIYNRLGCNHFASVEFKCTPIAFWHSQDIDEFIESYNIPLPKEYYPPYNKKRTGCVFCGFGKGSEFANKILASHNKSKESIQNGKTSSEEKEI